MHNVTDRPDADEPGAVLSPLSFDALAGWAGDDHRAAFRAFLLSAAHIADSPPTTHALGLDGAALAAVARQALALGPDVDTAAARRFFETRFTPLAVGAPGFLTGYYEPELEGSRIRSERFSVPLYARPADLVRVDDAIRPDTMDRAFEWARRTERGLETYPDRAAIEAGALEGQGLELVFLADPVDAFFVHIQGSARIRLAEGGTMRVSFAAKSGHPYTPVGRMLRERGVFAGDETITMASIRAWFAANPGERQAVMNENRSFIFFHEAPLADESLGPVAAAGVPLTSGRSLAVDRKLHTFHVPVFVETRLPDGAEFARLLVAQDTGSAIVGPARGDIFFGSGDAAGAVAGAMQSPGRFVLLAPRGEGAP